ncbi:unnamed protein product, partial [Ectocarpus sp. 12 AP-2014]
MSVKSALERGWPIACSPRATSMPRPAQIIPEGASCFFVKHERRYTIRRPFSIHACSFFGTIHLRHSQQPILGMRTVIPPYVQEASAQARRGQVQMRETKKDTIFNNNPTHHPGNTVT